MLGGPRMPQESKPHQGPFPRCPGPVHHARLSRGAGPPLGTHRLRRGLAPAWWRPPPLRRCSPSGEPSGTNQPPGVVRPSGWGLIDTRWPLPRGRLGGGSARQGGQALGRGAAPRPGRFRPPLERPGRSGGRGPPLPSSPPLLP